MFRTSIIDKIKPKFVAKSEESLLVKRSMGFMSVRENMPNHWNLFLLTQL